MKSGRRKTLKRKTMKRKTMKRKTLKRNYKGGAAANGGNTRLQFAMESYNTAKTKEDKDEWLKIIEEINRRGSIPAPTSAKQNMIDYVRRMALLTNQQKREHIKAMRYPY